MSEVAIVDLRYLAESQPSLCIPRVFKNISETRIRQVFDELGLGKISRIDIKERRSEKGDSFQRVYIHFDKWFWNEDAQAARRKLISGKEIKIVYDNPWFWKVSASKWAPSGNLQERGPPLRSRPHIDFEDDTQYRVTDEFGRDLKMRKDYEDSRSSESRETVRDNRRQDNRRPDKCRQDNHRQDNRRQDNRRQDNRRQDNRRQDNRREHSSRLPIAPSLTCKAECAMEQMTEKFIDDQQNQHSVSISPPGQRHRSYLDFDKPSESVGRLELNYGNNPFPVTRRRIVKKKIPEELEEGEIQDEQDIYSEPSEADRKACDELYGDL